MDKRKLIVVLGATGQQGGGVIHALIHSERFKNSYKIRGITRNPESTSSKRLTDLGVEMYRANLSIPEELTGAFQGAYAVFAVTDFWDKETLGTNDIETEERQGKQIADVASKLGVHHFIYSTLDDVKTLSKNEFDVPFFTGKHNVHRYIEDGIRKGSLKFQYRTYVKLGFYATNFGEGMPEEFASATINDNGVTMFTIPGLRPDVALPIVDPRDVGFVILQCLEKPKNFGNGNCIDVCSEYVTVGQIANIYQEVTGDRALASFIPYEEHEKALANTGPLKGRPWLVHSKGWFNKYGYYCGRDISKNREIFPQLKTWREFLVESNWRVQRP